MRSALGCRRFETTNRPENDTSRRSFSLIVRCIQAQVGCGDSALPQSKNTKITYGWKPTKTLEYSTRENESTPSQRLTSPPEIWGLFAFLGVVDETRFAIIGKRGEAAGFAKDHLGSNLERLVRTSTRPTIVVSRAFKPIRRFLLAFDGSPSAQRAVERLVEGSVLDGLECHTVSVGTPNSEVGKKLDAAAQALRDVGYLTTDHLVQGDATTAIAKMITSIDADMLVLGKAGHSRIRRLFIGSTTLELMQSCHVPVLVFP